MYDCVICEDRGTTRNFVGGYTVSLCNKHARALHRHVVKKDVFVIHTCTRARQAAYINAGMSMGAVGCAVELIKLDAKLYKVCKKWIKRQKEESNVSRSKASG